MGLIITSEINTDGGSTQSAYINISKFDLTKGGDTRAHVNLYLNKEAREANDKDTVSCRTIVKRFGVVTEELDPAAIYTGIYSKLRLILEEAGFTVEDDI
jgi:hypothetical protein